MGSGNSDSGETHPITYGSYLAAKLDSNRLARDKGADTLSMILELQDLITVAESSGASSAIISDEALLIEYLSLIERNAKLRQSIWG
jgi:hypothetical protein